MTKQEILNKLRPTALLFAVLLSLLAGLLIWWGVPAAVASGSESAVNMIYLIIGTAIGGLIGAMQKLCEDTPAPPPAQVPETTVLGLLRLLEAPVIGDGHMIVEESHMRPREGLVDVGPPD